MLKQPLKMSDRLLKAPHQHPAGWKDKLGAISSSHTQVTGMLAGFSATIVVLIIGLHFGNNINLSGNQAAEASLGTFAMAFFGYVAAGILFSISVEREGAHQYFLFGTASILYYFSGILSFAAVYPLIRLVQSSALQRGVLIMVLGGMFGGYLAASIPLHDLLLIKRKCIFGVFFAVVGGSFALYVLLTSALGAQSPTLLLWLLIACSLVVVVAFAYVVLSFFFPTFNNDALYRLTSLVLIALATATLCFAIGIGARAEYRTAPVRCQLSG